MTFSKQSLADGPMEQLSESSSEYGAERSTPVGGVVDNAKEAEVNPMVSVCVH